MAAKRKAKAEGKVKGKGVIAVFSAELLSEVDAWCAEHGVDGEPVNRSVGIRALVRRGLAQ